MVFKCFYKNKVYKDLFNSYDKRNPKEKTQQKKKTLLTLCLYFKIGLVKMIMILTILLAILCKQYTIILYYS